MQSVRIIDLPGMKMVSSGVGMFGDGKLERFAEWFSALPQGLYPEDFLCGNEQGMFWLFPYRSGMDIGAFELVDFQGGLSLPWGLVPPPSSAASYTPPGSCPRPA